MQLGVKFILSNALLWLHVDKCFFWELGDVWSYVKVDVNVTALVNRPICNYHAYSAADGFWRRSYLSRFCSSQVACWQLDNIKAAKLEQYSALVFVKCSREATGRLHRWQRMESIAFISLCLTFRCHDRLPYLGLYYLGYLWLALLGAPWEHYKLRIGVLEKPGLLISPVKKCKLKLGKYSALPIYSSLSWLILSWMTICYNVPRCLSKSCIVSSWMNRPLVWLDIIALTDLVTWCIITLFQLHIKWLTFERLVNATAFGLLEIVVLLELFSFFSERLIIYLRCALNRVVNIYVFSFAA